MYKKSEGSYGHHIGNGRDLWFLWNLIFHDLPLRDLIGKMITLLLVALSEKSHE